MSATDLAAVIIAVAALGVTALAVATTITMRRTAAEVAVLAAELRGSIASEMDRLDQRTTDIETELARVDGLVESAERISARADTLSKMTYGAVARPVIKTAAVMKGTGRAARRLRGRDLDERAG
jgi:hypothetical protein